MSGKMTAEESRLLRQCFLFKNANEAALEKMTERAMVRDFPKGSVLYDRDNCPRELGFVISGRLEATRGDYVINALGPGSLLGVAAIFNPEQEFVSRITARSLSRVAFFTQEALVELMRLDFSIAEAYIAFLTNRIRFLNGKIGGLLLSGSDTAVRHWLSQNVRRVEDRNLVQVASYTKLAANLNMSRSTLYRAIDELEAAGLIRKYGKQIEVPAPEALIVEDV